MHRRIWKRPSAMGPVYCGSMRKYIVKSEELGEVFQRAYHSMWKITGQSFIAEKEQRPLFRKLFHADIIDRRFDARDKWQFTVVFDSEAACMMFMLEWA